MVGAGRTMKRTRNRREVPGSEGLEPGYYVITPDADAFVVWKRLPKRPGAVALGRFGTVDAARASVHITWRDALAEDPFVCYGWDHLVDRDGALEVSVSLRGDRALVECLGVLDETGAMRLLEAVESCVGDVRCVVIDCGGVSDADDTGIHLLGDAISTCHAVGADPIVHLPPVLLGRADLASLRRLMHLDKAEGV